MPHVIYLHSALTQDRIVAEGAEDARRLLRYTRVDVIIAMSLAGLINLSMLVMAAATFGASGLPGRRLARGRSRHPRADPRPGRRDGVRDRAPRLRPLVLGRRHALRPGGDAGLRAEADPGHRPAARDDGSRRSSSSRSALDPSRTLVISQVVLSFGIPFALVPLIMFTSRRDLMGPLVNRRITTVAAIGVAVVIIALNAFLLVQTFGLG